MEQINDDRINEERYIKLIQLCNSVEELRDTMKMMGEYVHEQQEDVDSIENYIESCRIDSKAADNEIKQAAVYEEEMGSWKMLGAGMLCIAVGCPLLLVSVKAGIMALVIGGNLTYFS